MAEFNFRSMEASQNKSDVTIQCLVGGLVIHLSGIFHLSCSIEKLFNNFMLVQWLKLFSIFAANMTPKTFFQILKPQKGTSLRNSASIEALWSRWLLASHSHSHIHGKPTKQNTFIAFAKNHDKKHSVTSVKPKPKFHVYFALVVFSSPIRLDSNKPFSHDTGKETQRCGVRYNKHVRNYLCAMNCGQAKRVFGVNKVRTRKRRWRYSDCRGRTG
jgi:hypothetical protein